MALGRTLLIILVLINAKSFAQVDYTWKNGRVTQLFFHKIEVDQRNVSIRSEGADQPVSGRWQVDSLLIFSPAVSLAPAGKYTLYSNNLPVLHFSIPSGQFNPEPITEFIPGNDTLPANQLKIYLVFDQPMKEGGTVDFVEVWDLTENVKVRDPFLDLRPELWSYSSDTLTLWFDPGRIKRDLIPNKKYGPVLKPGHSYEIRLLPGLISARGTSMTETWTKSFVAGPDDRVSPDPSSWKISIPKKGTRAPVIIKFDEAMDPMTLVNYTEIIDKDNSGVKGSYQLSQGSDQIMFYPVNNWKTGEYKIIFNPMIEDLAGNRFHRLFDQEGPSAEEEPVEIVIHIP